jgi:DNA-binding transcriptional ArsR family regulator
MEEKLGTRKLQILKTILRQGRTSIAEIQRATNIPRSSLIHHLKWLESRGYIIQERKGKIIENIVSPSYAQKLRKELKIKVPKLLISGYTYDPSKPDIKTLELLQRALDFLEKEGIKVEKTIAFTTPLAQKKIKEAGYIRGNEEVPMEYEIYSNRQKKIEREMRKRIEQNILTRDILVDLTPLSKLFTIVGLYLSKEYGLRSFYHAGEKLIWLT